MGTVVAKQTPWLEWDSLGAQFFPGKYGNPWGTVVPKTVGEQLCGTFGVTVVLGNYRQQLACELLATGFQDPSTLVASAMRLLPSRQATTSQLHLQASDQLRSIATARLLPVARLFTKTTSMLRLRHPRLLTC